MRGSRAARKVEQLVTDASGDVDLPRGARDDVDLHKLLPQSTNTIVVLLSWVRVIGNHLVVDGGIALRVEGEFKALHAVVVGEVSHKGSKCPWWRGDIEEDFGQGWRSGAQGTVGC